MFNSHLIFYNKELKEILNKKIIIYKNNYTDIKQILLRHYDNKYSCFQRFFYVKDVLLKKYPLKYVIFIDDDQYFKKYDIEKLYKLTIPKTYTCFYCKKHPQNFPAFVSSRCRKNKKAVLFPGG